MSLSNLNQFLESMTSSLNLNGVRLTVLIVGLIEFFLVHILLTMKRVSGFFLGLGSQLLSSNDRQIANFYSSTKQEKIRTGGQSVCRGEAEIVLRSLGLLCCGAEQEEEEKLPSRVDANDLFNMFEERNPGMDEVREAFNVFDGNGDGFIDAEDLQKVLCALGFKEGSDMNWCRRMIGVFDENGDGRMNFGEFVKFMENSFS